MRHIDAHVRNILKCTFVDRVVVSSHNPAMRIELQCRVRDPRVEFVNQDVPRGCGHRWVVARDLDAGFLMVFDDDVRLFSWQVAKLFRHLIAEPDVPHGLAGLVLRETSIDYYEREEASVDLICEGYALTRRHLDRYDELATALASDASLSAIVEASADFALISAAGTGRPKVHDLGRIYRCDTFSNEGVAVHRERGFWEGLARVRKELNAIREAGPGVPLAPSLPGQVGVPCR
jgi:hypothetical protein